MSQPIAGRAAPPATIPLLVLTIPSPSTSPSPPATPPPLCSGLLSPPIGLPPQSEIAPASADAAEDQEDQEDPDDPEAALALEKTLFLDKIRAWLGDKSLRDSLPVLIWLLGRSSTYGEFCAQRATQFASLFSKDETTPLFTFEYPEHADRLAEFFWDLLGIISWEGDSWEGMSTDVFEIMFKSVAGTQVENRLREGYAPIGYPSQETAAGEGGEKGKNKEGTHFETAHMLEYMDEPLDAAPDPVATPKVPPPRKGKNRPEPSRATRDFAKKISANEFLNTDIDLLLTNTDIMSLCDRYFQLEERGEFKAKEKTKKALSGLG